jgi:2-keto-3-deoxy-L-rhamnonate aldolase RhmA
MLRADRAAFKDIVQRDAYSFVTLDAQHSPYDEVRLVEYCAMADELGLPVQLRIKHTRHAYLIGNVMDLGPAAVEVPLCEEREVAEEAVSAFYYPPLGKRSWGGAETRWGRQARTQRRDYSDWWNRTGVLCLQIETLRAVMEIKSLCLPGVDCFTWGPMDLEYDFEMNPRHPLKTIDDCLRYALRELEGTGKRMSFRNFSVADRSKYLDMGITVLMEFPRK